MLNHGTYDIINGDFKTAKEKWTIGYESCEPVIYKANDI